LLQTILTYNLRSSGQILDSQAGLSQNWNRDYDPAIGRYVESDPIGLNGGINTYAYVQGKPISYADPHGLWAGQVGLGGSVTTPRGASLSLSFGFAFDSSGGFGTYQAGGPGLGVGTGESWGLSLQLSPNSQTINDLSGPFNAVSAGLGAGAGGTVDGFTGTTTDGRQIYGGGFTIGQGLGMTSFDGVTNTFVQPWVRPRVKTVGCGSQ
jgi:RHS repeat-associated protein